MPESIWITTVEQLTELCARYGVTVLQTGIEGDDVVFWTRDLLPEQFYKDFEVEEVTQDGDRDKVAIYPKTHLIA